MPLNTTKAIPTHPFSFVVKFDKVTVTQCDTAIVPFTALIYSKLGATKPRVEKVSSPFPNILWHSAGVFQGTWYVVNPLLNLTYLEFVAI